MNDQSSYVLDESSLGAGRLEILDRTYGPGTNALLSRVPVVEGMRVADFGCGSGLVSTWLAKRVGPQGTVTAVDSSKDLLGIARRRATEQGRQNVEFVEADVYDSGLEKRRFDMVFCRFLLVHLQRPTDCLRIMDALLKPGGYLVCEECEVSSLFTVPRVPEYEEMLDLMLKVGRGIGVDYDLGPKLAGLFIDIGYKEPKVYVQQPAYVQGEEKRFWEYSFLEGVPKAVAAGLLQKSEVERIARAAAAAADDEKLLIGLARSFQVCGRKSTAT